MTTNVTALASRFRVEVTEDLTLAGGWLKMFGLTDFKSSVNQNLVETSDYDNDGNESYEKTFQGWSAVATVWVRTPAGVFTPSYEALNSRELLFGDACRIGIRWYDKNGLPEAFQGIAIVQTERGSTGVKDPDQKTFTLQGDGPLVPITNPGTAESVPVVTSVSPNTGATAGGNLVTISGSGFSTVTGATGVKFGANNATQYTVVSGSDTRIVAEVPAGTAGAKDVIVTNTAGASTTGTGAYTYA
jgi:hypothetical protein